MPLNMCSYGYDSLPLDATGSPLGGSGGFSFAGAAQGGNVGASGGVIQTGGVAQSGGLTGGGTGGLMSVAGQPSTGGTSTTGGSGGTGGAASGGTGGAASGGTGGAASGGTGGAASGGTGGAASGGTGGAASGLVGHWKLDELDTTGAVLDSSSNANNGVYSAAKPQVSALTPPNVQFSNPSCLSFSGSQHVQIPYTPAYAWTNTSSFTLAAWAFVPAFAGGWRAVIAHEDLAVNANYCGIWLNPLNEWSFEPNTTRAATSPASVGWHHIAAVQDGAGNIRRIYVDGILSSNTDTAINCSNPLPYHIGSGDGDDFWVGRIDDVRLYSRALTPAEITSLAAGN